MSTCGKDTSLPSVPRSKGCLTCVARKSRCDGRRPTCQACEDRKQICRGYRRDNFVFLNDGWRAPGVSKVGRNKPAESRKKLPTKTKQVETHRPGYGTQLEPDISTVASPPTLHRSPSTDRSQLSTAFFITQFSTRFITRPHFMADLFRTYFSLDPQFDTAGHGLGVCLSASTILAVEALAQGHFGRAKSDETSVQQSFRKYSLALSSMSSCLSTLALGGTTLDGLDEENWQHLAFFCVVMAFWELKMCPTSKNWQSHIRALADAIAFRGEDHSYSRTNKRLIAASRLMISLESLSSRQLGSLTPYEWRKRSTIRAAWLTEAQTTIYTSEDVIPPWGYDVYTFLDSLMDALPAVASLIGRYDRLVVNILEADEADNSDAAQALLGLYHEAEILLSHTESSATRWETTVYEVSIEESRSGSKSGEDHANDHFQFWAKFEPDFQSLFDTVLHFRSMHEYQAFTLFWTVAMLLHLQLSDMLSLMMAIKPGGIPGDLREKINSHRVQLIGYVENVLRAIAFAEDVANRRLAPFFITTAFQMTTVVLGKECEILREGQGNQEAIHRYETMKALAWRYLKWGLQSKIPIKLDTSGCLT